MEVLQDKVKVNTTIAGSVLLSNSHTAHRFILVGCAYLSFDLAEVLASVVVFKVSADNVVG